LIAFNINYYVVSYHSGGMRVVSSKLIKSFLSFFFYLSDLNKALWKWVSTLKNGEQFLKTTYPLKRFFNSARFVNS